MEDTEFIIRLIIALLLGSGLGLERQWRQRMARLLTNSLVCIGGCLFVMLSMMIEGDSSRTRVIAQVVSGIGFLAEGKEEF
ncbi:MAG: MgtC/SapB family protein [Cyanobacteria bacterium]|nr:MgtC/SapB family protein [Cyanobacteria bacterium CG_2015-16_32_12]NCO78935.1 MgtC/SapB family protein [Cyanobacteria bacterium CG_2015-22_32_23]NCQ04956.1 MgtC/SapB family protein [Cyanobacteria bacterium CG_2015-09_32_10]NCQ42715.1 MgtC/SapB family protein [Cyanobacteria bacterium CG_2015-04_32_10]NCS83808.1 MgtC/SapB family protein [Cyanobacteria bacterium CG_2015-02_32_10]